MKKSLLALALLTACALPGVGAHAQNADGRLYLVNRATGNQLAAGIDFPGQFRPGQAGTHPDAVGVSEVVGTPAGLVLYNRRSGVGRVVRIGADGRLDYGDHLGFSPNWDIIVGLGNRIFFYSSNGAAAIGHIAPNGAYGQTQSLPAGSLSPWTHIAATDNYLFFYNSRSGITAVAAIDPNGHLAQTASGQTRAGYGYIITQGDRLVLYNQQTGAYESGGIRLASVGGALRGRYELSSSGSIAPGFNKLVEHNGQLLLYNVGTGQALIGYLGRSSDLTGLHSASLSPGWTRIVSTYHYLFFYNGGTSAGAAALGIHQPRWPTGDHPELQRRAVLRRGGGWPQLGHRQADRCARPPTSGESAGMTAPRAPRLDGPVSGGWQMR